MVVCAYYLPGMMLPLTSWQIQTRLSNMSVYGSGENGGTTGGLCRPAVGKDSARYDRVRDDGTIVCNKEVVDV